MILLGESRLKSQSKWHEADDDSSSDSASRYYSDDSQEPEVSASIKAQDTLADMQCLQELLMPRHHLDADTRELQNEIGCHEHYVDPDFLHKCLPSCYPRGVVQDKLDKAIPLVKGKETLSGRHAPSIFLLTSTNPRTQMQFTQTHANLVTSGMTVIPLLGLDGERVPVLRRNAWRRAFVSWGHKGFPQAKKHISASTMKSPSDESLWWAFAEDSCKLITYETQATYETHFLSLIMQSIALAPPNIEIIQLGYRKLTGKKPAAALHLDTMRRDDKAKPEKVMRVMGQKLFVATSKGVDLLHKRLLCGPIDYFDTCMHELTRAGVAMRTEIPLAGSREHYSLVNGGTITSEEMPVCRA